MTEQRLWEKCSYILGMKENEDYQKQYEKCEDCHKYSICLKAKEELEKELRKPRGCINNFDGLFGRKNGRTKNCKYSWNGICN